MSRRVERFFQIRNYFWYNLLFWVIISALETIQTFSFSKTYFEAFEIEFLIRWPLSVYLTYWILSLIVIRIYISSLSFKSWKFTGFHLLVSLIFGIVHKFLHPLIGLLLERLFLPKETLPINEILSSYTETTYDFLSGAAIYWLLILIFQALNYYRKLQDKSQRALELESELSVAQLQWMKMQLNPHFLFNAFNTISMMVRNKKNDSAVEMISDLSSMLRQSLSGEARQFITLEEEIQLTQKYLNIESKRYQDRVKIVWEVDESQLKQKVPSMILQPIVENAFKHGVSKSLGSEVIRIVVKREDPFLILSVFNSGSQLGTDWDFQQSKGIGLANTSDRLTKIYQQDSRILINETEEGIEVSVQIPIKNES